MQNLWLSDRRIRNTFISVTTVNSVCATDLCNTNYHPYSFTDVHTEYAVHMTFKLASCSLNMINNLRNVHAA